MRHILHLLSVVGIAAVLMVATNAEAAQSTQSNWDGEPICGGINLKTGKILPPCGFSKAKFEGKARKSCPAGTFFDLGTWSCFKCPSGFNRSANDINGDAACSKAVSKKFFSAKFEQKFARCPSGSFLDGRNQGECWKCPASYGRTLAPVDAWNACGKFGANARSAELVARVCPAGTFGDLRNGGECWTCPSGSLRSSLPVNGSQACYRTEMLVAAERTEGNICKKGALFDPINGGTCWTCPVNSVRSILSVTGPEACENPIIQWKSAKRDAKSLFHIPGGDAVTRAVIADRAPIENLSRKAAIEGRADVDKRVAEDWQLIAKTPHESGLLIGAVYARVLELIENGPKTKDERDLLAYFAKYVQETRQLTALQMRDVYASWKAYADNRMATTGSSVAQFYNLGAQPPELDKVVHGVMGITGGGMMIGGFSMLALNPTLAGLKGTIFFGFAKSLTPYMMGSLVKPLTGTLLQAAAGASGPLVILTGAAIVGALGIDIIAKNVEAQAKIDDAIAIAKRPVVLKRLLLSEAGQSELLNSWMIMTQATKAPRIRFNVNNITSTTAIINLGVVGTQVAATPKASAPLLPKTVWENIDGAAARDVAIGSDSTTYIVSTDGNEKSGYLVFKRGKNDKKWTSLGITAVRIAVGNREPWIIDSAGRVFKFFQNSWREVRGNISGTPIDIGASKKGVWMTTNRGGIYRHTGGGWQMVKGSSTAFRIDVDWDGNPWIVNDKGEIFVRKGNAWSKTTGLAVDVAVDMPGFARVVGTDGKIYSHNAGKWTQRTQNDVAAGIGVGGGQVWGIAKNAAIFRKK